MQHLVADSFAQHRQADLLREAEMARLADLATAGHPSLVSKVMAAAGRLIVGETGVATRHATVSTVAPSSPATPTAGMRSETGTTGVSGRRAATVATRSIARPSPSL